LLKYTGHPLVDVGAATIAAYSGRRDIGSVTESDLDQVVRYLAGNYVVNPLKSFLTVAFPNSGFTNPAFEKTPEKRVAYAQRVLTAYRGASSSSGERCVFTKDPALDVALSDAIPAGRAYRQHIPLITGEGIINFSPNGDAGLAVSGLALLCIQALPLGCAKCGGKLLAVHSDSPDLTLEVAAEFLKYNLEAINLAQQSGTSKLREARASAKTLLIETLIDIEQRRRERLQERRPASVTAYHFTNSGQSNPLDRNSPLEIYHLPLEVTEFLSWVTSPDYRDEWRKLVQRAWRLAKLKKGKEPREGDNGDGDSRPRLNFLYEDVFRLPEGARWFIRRYFVRAPIRSRFDDDPRRSYSLQGESDLVSWHLTELFLKKVMRMDDERIQEIRNLGDRLATHILRDNGKRFFRGLFENRYDYFRMNLIRGNLSAVQQGQPPLVTFDPYVAVFEDGYEIARPDWRLARDLLLIRVVEQLHQQGWLRSNPDAVPEQRPEDEVESERVDAEQ